MRVVPICLALTIILSFGETSAQCIAFAGHDTTFCSGTSNILSEAFVSGGVPPYSYTWFFGTLPPNYTTSDILDDSTKLNPTIILSRRYGIMDFELTVSDAVGDTCRDTISVFFNSPVLTISSDTNYINAGDSIRLNVFAASAFPPYRYHWEPSLNISDASISNPIATPSATTTYYVTATDSLGCAHTDSITIYIGGVGIFGGQKESEFNLFPNPTESESWMTTDPSGNFEVLLFNSQGKKINSFYFSGDGARLDTKDLPQGVFYVLLYKEGKLLGTQKLIKII